MTTLGKVIGPLHQRGAEKKCRDQVRAGASGESAREMRGAEGDERDGAGLRRRRGREQHRAGQREQSDSLAAQAEAGREVVAEFKDAEGSGGEKDRRC